MENTHAKCGTIGLRGEEILQRISKKYEYTREEYKVIKLIGDLLLEKRVSEIPILLN